MDTLPDRRRSLVLWAALVLGGCGSNSHDTGVSPSEVVPGGTPSAGGQSGVEGEVPPDPISPGIPPDPCELVQTQPDPSDPILGGSTAAELLERLGPGAAIPLYWVAYDGPPAVSYAPGPGETTLTPTLTLRDGDIVKRNFDGDDPSCGRVEVELPVTLALATGDGALDERLDATLELAGPHAASLIASLPIEEVQGSFRVLEVEQGEPGTTTELIGMQLQMSLSPGESSGSLTPQLVLLQADGTPAPPTPPPLTALLPRSTPSDAGPDGLYEPESFRALAVWPTKLRCASPGGGRPLSADAPVIGLSVREVIEALDAQDGWQLSLADGGLPVTLQLDPPGDWYCGDVGGDALRFTATGTLLADAAGVDADASTLAIAALDAATVYDVTAETDAESAELTRLRFTRRDVVYELTRAELEATTGLVLDAPEEYQRFWWSSHGELSRDADGQWTLRGGLTVSSLDAEQQAEAERVVGLGGPGPSISTDQDTGWPVLPGDVLLDASLTLSQ